MGELKISIQEIQKKDLDKFYEIVKKMEPLMKKYMRILYKEEKEDIHSELVLALWEAVIKMTYVEEEGQIMSYLCKALHMKFLELYRKSRKQHDLEFDFVDFIAPDRQVEEREYSNRITEHDMNNLVKDFSGIKKDIYLSMLLGSFTDVQIAFKFGISRQYANRLRKQLSYILQKEYFEDGF